MSVPYGSAYESAEAPSPETPEEFLARLLGRALNSFELPEGVLRRLECALAFDSSLHSAQHSAGMHRETYRHTWLLADGQAVTLWELVHDTGPLSRGPRPHEAQYELYAYEEDLRAATSRLPLPEQASGFEVARLVRLPAPPVPRRVYVRDASADHARRLLRRAENADRPGAGVAALLARAVGHEITQAFGRPSWGGPARLGYALYEHAFLLDDGREVSLWEVEHTATPDGRHMCEVYMAEGEARGAMELRSVRPAR
ncbi:DUF6227 family protein [Streptomyces sp. NPDC058045]|uniref:DUF6227 family protein n=1 Tax=Streptomyces sp. NPDC058045 TaxID=3346311 RepID=UPI0036E50887